MVRNNCISKSLWIIEIHRLAAFLSFIRGGIGEGLMDFRSFTSVYTLAIQVLKSQLSKLTERVFL